MTANSSSPSQSPAQSPPPGVLTHIALPVRDLDATLEFYAKYTTLVNIHERTDDDTGMRSVWLANERDRTLDGAARFVIVLICGKLSAACADMVRLRRTTGAGAASASVVAGGCASRTRASYCSRVRSTARGCDWSAAGISDCGIQSSPARAEFSNVSSKVSKQSHW